MTDVVEIPIQSAKYGKQTVLIDKEDLWRIQNTQLGLSKSGQFLYVRLSSKAYLHRIVTEAPANMVVDHINRNTLDNRKSNLRIVTIQENLRNQKRPNNKTGYTGVAIMGKKYTAQIKHNYKKIHLGVFDTIPEALKARQAAEKRLWQ